MFRLAGSDMRRFAWISFGWKIEFESSKLKGKSKIITNKSQAFLKLFPMFCYKRQLKHYLFPYLRRMLRPANNDKSTCCPWSLFFHELKWIQELWKKLYFDSISCQIIHFNVGLDVNAEDSGSQSFWKSIVSQRVKLGFMSQKLLHISLKLQQMI